MRKSLVAIIVLALVAFLVLVLKRSDSTDPSPVSAEVSTVQGSDAVASEKKDSETQRPRWTKPTRTETEKQETSASGKAIVYDASDFARGELQNIVVDDGLRLGNDASFVPRFDPRFRLFGNFVSPEIDSPQPFDALSLNLQASALGENAVIFEIRTRNRFGEWTEWREVSPDKMKEPISAEVSQSTGWQYRVALFANDAAGSPKVETISIEPLSTTAQNFSANNNTK